MTIQKLLCEEIGAEFDELKSLKVGSDEYRVAVEGLAKLIAQANEMDRLDVELNERLENREKEYEWKEKQAKEERTDRIVKDVIAVAGIVIPVAVTIWGTLKSFKFEEEGTITTIMGRGFINKLLPKK